MKTKSKKRWVKKLVISLIVVIILAGAALGIMHIVGGPAVGTVAKSSTATKPMSPQPVSQEQLDGTYISFIYPDNYHPNNGAAAGDTMLEKHQFVSDGPGIKLLTVTVTSLPSGNLKDDPSYLMRTEHPETYQLEHATVNGESVVYVKKIDSFEEVAFWAHGTKLATLAISGNTMNQQADEAVYRQIVQSVTWH